MASAAKGYCFGVQGVISFSNKNRKRWRGRASGYGLRGTPSKRLICTLYRRRASAALGCCPGVYTRRQAKQKRYIRYSTAVDFSGAGQVRTMWTPLAIAASRHGQQHPPYLYVVVVSPVRIHAYGPPRPLPLLPPAHCMPPQYEHFHPSPFPGGQLTYLQTNQQQTSVLYLI